MPASGDKIYAADVDDLGDYTIRRPLVRLIQQSAQSLTDNTATAITFGASSEDIDTHGFHDTATNNSRITPTIAGYYLCTGILWLGGATTLAQMWSAIYKNGASVLINRCKPDLANTTAPSVQVSTIVSLNGSTDYVELYALQDDTGGAARNTTTGAANACTLEAIFLRPL